jgi:hypothetical protein
MNQPNDGDLLGEYLVDQAIAPQKELAKLFLTQLRDKATAFRKRDQRA